MTEFLSNILKDFCEKNNLPYRSADELMGMTRHKPELREWLINYMKMWDSCEELLD